MKTFSLAAAILSLTIFGKKCDNKNEIYKGRLEVKGICMNYTIKLIEGELDTSAYVAEWKDEITGKTHNNVFALGSACSFPATIKEGDEFYFRIDSTYVSNCAVCMAYYPRPPKRLAIKVIEKK